MNRGGVFVKVRVWQVNRDGSINRRSVDVEYGHSAVTDLNSRLQQELSYQKAINQALKQYRNSHRIGSDTEINYHLLASGIVSVGEYRGKHFRKVKKLHLLTPYKKRQLHQVSYLGKDKPIKLSEVNKMELTEKQYSGKKREQEKLKRRETEHYVIDTGTIHKNKSKKAKK